MKYKARLVKKICEDLRQGYNVVQTCTRQGITEETYYVWKRDKPEFSEAVEAAAEEKWARMVDDVPPSIKKLLNGYKETYLERTGELSKENDPATGKPKLEVKEVKEVTKIFPPQGAFMQFFLKNMIPQKFSDKSELKVSGDLNVSNTRFRIKRYGLTGTPPDAPQEPPADGAPDQNPEDRPA